MKNLYQCEICQKVYVTPDEASQCEGQGQEEALFKIGDIVLINKGFGWFDGVKNWVVGSPERQIYPMNFYYVVTAIDTKPGNQHDIAYHLATLAMSGKQGHRDGWTSKHHYMPVPAHNVPESVVKESKRLIGRKFQNLL